MSNVYPETAWGVIEKYESVIFIRMSEFEMHCKAIGVDPNAMNISGYTTLEEAKQVVAKKVQKRIDELQPELDMLRAKLACCT